MIEHLSSVDETLYSVPSIGEKNNQTNKKGHFQTAFSMDQIADVLEFRAQRILLLVY